MNMQAITPYHIRKSGMNKDSSLLGQLVDSISGHGFRKLVETNKTEYCTKGLSRWAQFINMIYGQVSKTYGLRSIGYGINN